MKERVVFSVRAISQEDREALARQAINNSREKLSANKKDLRDALSDLMQRVEFLEDAVFDESEECDGCEGCEFDEEEFDLLDRKQKLESEVDSAIILKIAKDFGRMEREEFEAEFEKRKAASLPSVIVGLNAAAALIHLNAVNHGWYDEKRTFGDIIALCHSELSEALEAFRRNEEVFYMESDKPEGVGVELVDCIIRILDYMASEGMDIERILALKHEYNVNRPYRHGGKAI